MQLLILTSSLVGLVCSDGLDDGAPSASPSCNDDADEILPALLVCAWVIPTTMSLALTLPAPTMLTTAKAPRTVEGMPLKSFHDLICGIRCIWTLSLAVLLPELPQMHLALSECLISVYW